MKYQTYIYVGGSLVNGDFVQPTIIKATWEILRLQGVFHEGNLGKNIS